MISDLDFSKQKGYNKCITCEDLGVICDGPNFTAMSPERFCEWCRLRKEYIGWTNAHLVEVSGVSKTTVDRIMAGTATGLNGETKSRMTCALIHKRSSNGEAWGQYPCPKGADIPVVSIDPSRDLELAEQRYNELKESDQKKIDFLKAQIEFKENQMLAKDKLLDERAAFMRSKDKTIATLSVLLGISVLLIIISLIVDRLNPDLGFFWRETLSVFIR